MTGFDFMLYPVLVFSTIMVAAAPSASSKPVPQYTPAQIVAFDLAGLHLLTAPSVVRAKLIVDGYVVQKPFIGGSVVPTWESAILNEMDRRNGKQIPQRPGTFALHAEAESGQMITVLFSTCNLNNEGLCTSTITMKFREKVFRPAVAQRVAEKYPLYTDGDSTGKWWGVWNAKQYRVDTAYPHINFRQDHLVFFLTMKLGSKVSDEMDRLIQNEVDRRMPKNTELKI